MAYNSTTTNHVSISDNLWDLDDIVLDGISDEVKNITTDNTYSIYDGYFEIDLDVLDDHDPTKRRKLRKNSKDTGASLAEIINSDKP